ncbi:MAG: DUF4116 domain-containing protein [Pseudomonadota bacterium]
MSKSDFNKRAKVESLMKSNQKIPQDLVDDFWDDKDVLFYAIEHNPYDILSANEVLTEDKDFMMKALDLVPAEYKSLVYSCAGETLSDDADLFLKAFKSADYVNAGMMVQDVWGNSIYENEKALTEALSYIQKSDWNKGQKSALTDTLIFKAAFLDRDLGKRLSRSFEMDTQAHTPKRKSPTGQKPR